MRLSKKIYGLIVPCLCLVSFLVPSSALAAEGGAQWTVSSVSRPTNFLPGGDVGGDAYVVLVTNTGSAANEEEGVPAPVTVTDELPGGLEPAGGVSAEDELGRTNGTAGHDFSGGCEADGEERKVSCTYAGVVVPDDTLILRFPVKVVAGEGAVVRNVVRVSGGGADAAGMQTPTNVFQTASEAKSATSFGVAPGGSYSALSSVQAGAHPDLTVSTGFNTENIDGTTAGNLKNTVTNEPPGFAGDLVDTPACAAARFLEEECPVSTQVGVITVISIGSLPGPRLRPVYNLAPEPGEVAKLGFNVGAIRYAGDVAVLPAGSPGAYGLQTTFYNITAGLIDFDSFSLTIWGVPAAAVHDPLRWQSRGGGFFGVSDGSLEAPFFTNPTACSGALQAEFSVTSPKISRAGRTRRARSGRSWAANASRSNRRSRWRRAPAPRNRRRVWKCRCWSRSLGKTQTSSRHRI